MSFISWLINNFSPFVPFLSQFRNIQRRSSFAIAISSIFGSATIVKYHLSDCIYEKISHYHVEDDKKLEINKKTSNFNSFIKNRLPKCNYMVERFKSKHSEWMSSKISITINENSKTPQKPGRRPLSYTNAGPRLKRKLASEHLKKSTTQIFLCMLQQFLRRKNVKQTWHRTLKKLLQHLLNARRN